MLSGRPEALRTRPVADLNYNHLRYFWVAACEGGMTAAAERLGVAQPTVSSQVRALEQVVGGPLFVRGSRPLALTETGRMVLRYAEQIFSLGQELEDTIAHRPTGGPRRLRVGLTAGVPRLVAGLLLEPVVQAADEVHLVIQQDRPGPLSAMLLERTLDLVITDAPLGATSGPRIASLEIAASPVAFLASPGLAAELDGPFPDCLEGAPILLPTPDIELRHELDRWLRARDLRPRVIAELDDSGMTKTLGSRGHGIFTAPTLVAGHVERRFEVVRIGEAPDLVERYHAIIGDGRIDHPMVRLVTSMRWSAGDPVPGGSSGPHGRSGVDDVRPGRARRRSGGGPLTGR